MCLIANKLLFLSFTLKTLPNEPSPILPISQYQCILIEFNNCLQLLVLNISKMTEGIDSKKAEFKNYLQKTGAVDQLTKVLVQLYQQNERPDKAVDYIRKFLGASGDFDAEKLSKDYDEAVQQNQKLKKQIADVKEQIAKRKKA